MVGGQSMKTKAEIKLASSQCVHTYKHYLHGLGRSGEHFVVVAGL